MIKKAPTTPFSEKTRAKVVRANTIVIFKDKSQLLHQGIWCYIFEFVGLNGDLFKIRGVSKLFRRYVHRTMENLIKLERSSTNSIEEKREKLLATLSPQLRDAISQALILRDLCNQGSLRILKSGKILDLACLMNPYPSIVDGLRASLYIISDPKQAKEIAGKDWNFYLILLRKYKFKSMLLSCDPMKLTDYQITQFDLIQEIYSGFLQGNVDASCYIAGLVLEYATSCVNLKKFANNMQPDAKECLQMLHMRDNRKSYIEKLEKIRGGFK